ncbi:hypothetical protein EVAR_10240_1 [Eumeta japonica]|uniref:Uncharacterized protein n=1 Tax=Eumeta variegata TaxID=151549 RepID=A0A4C1TEQ7_EUMVA|nr:hypothetical protein EVAR_10240_1 [Eumeta japonica]
MVLFYSLTQTNFTLASRVFNRSLLSASSTIYGSGSGSGSDSGSDSEFGSDSDFGSVKTNKKTPVPASTARRRVSSDRRRPSTTRSDAGAGALTSSTSLGRRRRGRLTRRTAPRPPAARAGRRDARPGRAP